MVAPLIAFGIGLGVGAVVVKTVNWIFGSEDEKMFDCSEEMSGFHDEKVVLQPKQREEMRGRRNANRTRLKKGLARNDKPSALGQRTQGSYAMKTMVQDAENDYDIDDGAYFNKDKLINGQGNEMSALSVRQMVRDAVDDGSFSKDPEVRQNCVRVYYKDGSHVDVPAYRSINKTSWTGEEYIVVELAGPDWRESDPKGVADWFKDVAKDKSPGDDPEQFYRIVRLLKSFSKSRPAWKVTKGASGFTITKLAEECFVGLAGRDDSSLRKTMQAIKERLEGDLSVDHPTVKGEKLATWDDAKTRRFKERLADKLIHLEILDTNCSRKDALKAWGAVFNDSYFEDKASDDESESCSKAKSAGVSGVALTSVLIIKNAEADEVDRAVDKQGGGKYA